MKFVICLLASVVVTMGFKLDKGDEGFPRREADEAQKGYPRREADETLEMSAYDAGDGGFMPTNEGFSRREANSDVPEEEDSVETKDIRTNNSTLSRQASYPGGCGWGRPDPSHLAIRLVKEAFDTYSDTFARASAIARKFQEAKKNPRIVTVDDSLPGSWYSVRYECVAYGKWFSTIYF